MQDEPATSFRLSPQQELEWSTQPDGPVGGAQLVLELTGHVDGARLREAVGRAIERHEILRTTFRRRPGMKTPLQVVQGTLAPEWNEEDLRGLEATEQQERLTQIASAAQSRSWEYQEGPLMTACLAALTEERQALVLTAAPPCADAGSIATIAGEIAAHYGGREAADSPLQYADFAEWQNELLSSDDDDAVAGRQFWSDAAAGPLTRLPFQRPVPAATTETLDVPVAEETLAAIESAATQYGVAESSIVLAAWHTTVAKLASEDEVTLGFVPSGRGHTELETAVGAFVRPLPLCSRPARDTSFAELAVALDRAVELAERWQDTAPLDSERSGVGFVAVEAPLSVEAGAVTFTCRGISAPSAFPVALEWDGRSCRLRYEPAAYDRLSAVRTARYAERVLAVAAASPRTIVGEIELLDEDDVRRLTVEVNETAANVPVATVAEFVTAAAAAAPSRTAVVDETGSITYGDLDERANKLAHRLQRSGVAAGSVVALCTDRSRDMVVGLVGILKAGAAYLPLNYEHPPARLAHQLAEAGVAAVVTQEELLPRLPSFDGDVVCLDRDAAALDAEPGTAPGVSASSDDLVYVIYTSGSTGTPKGVGVTNANLCNYVRFMGARLGADEPLAFGMVSAISTDLGNTAVFPALCHGGTLVLVRPGAAADSAAAAEFLRANPIDVLKITPSHLNALLVGADAAGVLPQRWLVVGGEALTWDLVARVRELGDCRILNHYGPTETTVGSCTYLLEDAGSEHPKATVPIGVPIANTYCYVLDERGRCVPEGVPGELHIGGRGVAPGYVGRPDLTAAGFLPDPFRGEGRVYATGDLVRRLPDATLEFLGRRDDQLKIRGFRVEPGEIEAALRAYEPVREAAVVAREDARGERRLVAYVATAAQVTSEQLRTHLAEWIPDYMVPSAFVTLESLPMTASGKIDRLALPEPESTGGPSTTSYVAPRTPVEESVAAIWADVLGVERVGVEDDFFALGGHSLRATQIVAQVRSDFSINLPLHALFTSPTVAALAQQIVELIGKEPDADTEKLLAELEGLSDEEVAVLLAAGRPPETPAR
jgi:amino acid adenylation domain-containing protein